MLQGVLATNIQEGWEIFHLEGLEMLKHWKISNLIMKPFFLGHSVGLEKFRGLFLSWRLKCFVFKIEHLRYIPYDLMNFQISCIFTMFQKGYNSLETNRIREILSHRGDDIKQM